VEKNPNQASAAAGAAVKPSLMIGNPRELRRTDGATLTVRSQPRPLRRPPSPPCSRGPPRPPPITSPSPALGPPLTGRCSEDRSKTTSTSRNSRGFRSTSGEMFPGRPGQTSPSSESWEMSRNSSYRGDLRRVGLRSSNGRTSKPTLWLKRSLRRENRRFRSLLLHWRNTSGGWEERLLSLRRSEREKRVPGVRRET